MMKWADLFQHEEDNEDAEANSFGDNMISCTFQSFFGDNVISFT